jgi:hypothetical protein
MSRNESASVPFDIFRSCFRTPPRVIVYDNACGLATYAMQREPVLFRDTLFCCDPLHWLDHTACSCAHYVGSFEQFIGWRNWEVCEQAHRRMNKSAASLSYMSQENFMYMSRYLWAIQNCALLNREVTQREMN